MHPILIDLGTHNLPLLGLTHVFLPTYGLFFALGVGLAWWWFVRRATSFGVDVESAFNLGFYAVLSGLVGAKLLLVVVEWRYYLENPREILDTLRVGGVLMGGVVLGAAVFVFYARRRGLPALRLGDAMAAPLALAQAIGRIGCYMAGCCWGVAAPGLWCAVTFHDPVAHDRTGVPLGQPLFPTQLLQMANDFILTLVLTWLWRRKNRTDGTVLWWYVLLYSLTRGIIEFWRGDTVRGVFLGGFVSTSQILALGGVLLGAAMLIVGRIRGRMAVAS